MKDFTFFWSPEQDNGFFSQWLTCQFIVDGVTYNCTEQYMMAEKARLFKDCNILEEIMDAEDPKVQKKLGRDVANFNRFKWTDDERNGRARCWNIVWRGNMAKFSQNTWLKDELLATEDNIIAEASPYDRIWGIGFRKNEQGARSPGSWPGDNWLGEVLMSVRSFLSNDDSPYLRTDDKRKPV